MIIRQQLYYYSSQNIYENFEDCNPTKKKRVLIVLNDMIRDMEANEK